MKDRIELIWTEDDEEKMHLAVDADFVKSFFKGLTPDTVKMFAKMASDAKEMAETKSEPVGVGGMGVGVIKKPISTHTSYTPDEGYGSNDEVGQ